MLEWKKIKIKMKNTAVGSHQEKECASSARPKIGVAGCLPDKHNYGLFILSHKRKMSMHSKCQLFSLLDSLFYETVLCNSFLFFFGGGGVRGKSDDGGKKKTKSPFEVSAYE